MTEENRQLTETIFELVTGDEEARLCRDIPESQCDEQAGNFSRQLIAKLFSKIGDVLADPKLVLPWLLGAVGAPAFMTGLLVPIRESLALLPQILIGATIRLFPVRKWFWVVASLVQGLCVALMGVVAAAGFSGAKAGAIVLGLLTVFSIARAVASVGSKDTLGKTVSRGNRGQVSGWASTGAGLASLGAGLYFILAPQGVRPDWLLFAMLGVAGLAWLVAALVFSGIKEAPGATEGGVAPGELLGDQIRLLAGDRELRKFLFARTLLVATAMSAPVYVAMAQQETGTAIGGLGWLLLASGAASFASSWFWGRLSDRSSRTTMALGGIMAALIAMATLVVVQFMGSLADRIEIFALAIFLSQIAYSGTRIGRKTHIVDLAGGDSKAEYVALSNTLIGVALVIVGGLSSLLLGYDSSLALAVLGAMALSGGLVSLTMRDVQPQS